MSTLNIDTYGYGKIYKSIMRNRTIPVLAKAIYSYFCSYAGSGYTAFPKRDKITADLQINKDTFTKHLNFLVGEGYISKERTTHGNLYTINQSLPAPATPDNAQEFGDVLVFEPIKAKGYGTVPKLLMFDKRLSAQAKAIYAFFSSFAGAGTTAFPRQTTIMREMRMSKSTYYRHFNQLVDAGYITVEHRKEDGRFISSIYRLSTEIHVPKNAMSEKTSHGKKKGSYTPNPVSTPVNQAVSEKSGHGGKLLKSTPAMSEKAVSEKAISEKTGYGNFGHANIRNRNINNISDKKQKSNHPGAWEPVAAVLQKEAEALLKLKSILGHFGSSQEKDAYLRNSQRVIKTICWQLSQLHDKATGCVIMQSPDAYIALFQDVMGRFHSIRKLDSYVYAAIKNMNACQAN